MVRAEGSTNPKGIQDLIPIHPNESLPITPNTHEEAKRFFGPLVGAELSGILLARYGDFDAIAVIAQSSALIIPVDKGSLIALDWIKKVGEPKIELAFREDTRTRRINLLESDLSGEVVSYPSDTKISGSVLNPEVFPSMFFEDGNNTVKSVKPSWYTEDWLSIKFEGDKELLVRTERHGIRGEVLINGDQIDYLCAKWNPNNQVQLIDFREPAMGKIPASLIIPSDETGE